MKKPLLATVLLLCPFAAFPAAEKPNIVLILVDDMGYADTQPYGSEIQTPHLMDLAQKGLRFTDFHNCAKCSPTRGALMTGLYPQQAGMAKLPKAGMNPTGEAGGEGELDRQAVTIAEVLKSAGYATYMAGKWHLTGLTKPDSPTFGWPRQRGFDRFFGFLGGVARYFDCDSLISDNTPVDAPAGSYVTDLFAEHASTFIAEHARTQPGKPFFLYLAFNAPHWGHTARDEDAALYKDTYTVGWDVLREQRLAKQKVLGVIPPDCALSPRNEDVPAWDSLNAGQKAEYAQAMAVYAGMITCMDRGIGRVLAALEAAQLRDNTLVVFLADNGASAEGATSMKRGKDGHLSGRAGAGWANVSNTPFRYWKNTTWQGGTATELILNWPNGLAPSMRGTVTAELGHVIDLMPTCGELAQATYPAAYNGNAIAPMEGRSLVPVLHGQSLGRRELFWQYMTFDSARRGSRKIIRKGGGDWQLFDLGRDPSEINDQSLQYPEEVKDLSALWQRWEGRVHAAAPEGTSGQGRKRKK